MTDEWADNNRYKSALRQQRKTHTLGIVGVQTETDFDHIRQNRDDERIKEGIYSARISATIHTAYNGKKYLPVKSAMPMVATMKTGEERHRCPQAGPEDTEVRVMV